MRNKLLISGLVLLLITALIVSASAVDVISVSELFSLGGDAQEEVAAAVSDAPEDNYTEDTSASEPAQESDADDAYFADDTDPDNTDNIADDTTGAPADGETPDENTPDTDTDPAQTPESDADLTASGELDDISVPEQAAIEDKDISAAPEDRSSDWIVHITNEVVTQTSGKEYVTNLSSVPEELQPRWSILQDTYGEGIYVEVPVYISLENNASGSASNLTGAAFLYSSTYTATSGAGVVHLDPKIEVDGFTVEKYSGNLYKVEYSGSLPIPEAPLKFMTLRYYLAVDLIDGNLTIPLYFSSDNAEAGLAFQYGGNTVNCNFYSSYEYEGETYYQIMGVDKGGWNTAAVEVTHTHVFGEFSDSFNDETYPATCTEMGKEAALCSSAQCQYSNAATPYYRDIPALGHTKSLEAPAMEPTCTEVGHVAYVYCEKCGHFIDPEDFAADEYTTEYLFDGADYDEDGNLPEYVAMTGHVKTEEAGHVASTCSVQGHVAYVYCGKCGHFIAPGDFEADVYTKNYLFDGAGYTADGKLPQYLELDGENHINDLTEIPYVEPNCLEGIDGHNQYWYCDNCHKYFKDEAGTIGTTVEDEVIPDNHTTTWYDAVDADCDSYGTIGHYECDVCGLKFATENPAGGPNGALQSVANPAEPPLGHEWVLTETATGYEAACPVCGETLVVTAIVGSQNNAELASKGFAQYQGFEIAIYDEDGNPIDPDTPIPVSIPLPEGFDVSRCVVYFVEEDGSLTELEYTYADGYLIVSVSHSGIYFVGEEAVAASGSGRYAPNTDDGNSPFLWMTLVFFGLSLAGLAAVTVGRRKYNR